MAEGGYDVDMDPLGEGDEDINDERQPLLESDSRISRALRKIRNPRARRRIISWAPPEEQFELQERYGFGPRSKPADSQTRPAIERYGFGPRSEPAVQTQETSFTNDGVSLENLEENQNTAEERIKELYPEWEPSKANFTFGVDEYGETVVRLKIKGSKKHLITSPGLPQTMLDSLGRSAEEIKEYDAGKTELDSLFPDNKITMEEGFDLRYNEGEIEITNTNLGMWHRLYNKKGGLNSKLPNKITDALGRSADEMLAANDDRRRVIEITRDSIAERGGSNNFEMTMIQSGQTQAGRHLLHNIKSWRELSSMTASRDALSLEKVKLTEDLSSSQQLIREMESQIDDEAFAVVGKGVVGKGGL